MTKRHVEIPQPTREEIFQRASELHQIGEKTNGGMRHLLLRHDGDIRRGGSYSERGLLVKAETMGRKLEDKDPEKHTIIDRTMPKKLAVVLGASAGHLILGDFYKSLFYNKDMLRDIHIDPNMPDEKMLGFLIAQYGAIGLDMLGPHTVNLLNEWRQYIFTDYDKRQLFSYTVGLVALGASNSRDKAEFEATFDRTPEEIDNELARLLEKGQ